VVWGLTEGDTMVGFNQEEYSILFNSEGVNRDQCLI
jgi:hypothetical protein